jgi:hypothetical protein
MQALTPIGVGGMRKISVLIFAALMVLVCQGFAQAKAPLPRGFDSIELGQDLATAKNLLQKNGYFSYRGDPDVSFLPLRKEVLIEAGGVTFIRRGLFHFQDDRLSTIILMLNPQKTDYFSLYSVLVAKYGQPKDLNPQAAFWEDDRVRFMLERPCTVKYVALAALKARSDRARIESSAKEEAGREFLGLF